MTINVKVVRWIGAEWATAIGSQQVARVHGVAAASLDPRNTAADRGITEWVNLAGGGARVDRLTMADGFRSEMIMSAPVAAIRIDANLESAIAMFKALPFSRLVVLNDEQKPVGILSREMVFKHPVARLDVDLYPISGLMTLNFATVLGSVSPEVCAEAIFNQGNSIVIVEDARGATRGVITRTDLINVSAVKPNFSAYA